MSVDPVELAYEQKYFDNAAEHRERTRADLGTAADSAANSGAAARIRQDAEKRRARLSGPEERVAFGRMDYEDGESLYLGEHAIFDDKSELLVVNWQAPAAAAFYSASHDDPLGLRFKRLFECDGNTIKSFEDTVFAQLAAQIQELEGFDAPSDTLLADLNSNRTGEMQDIVRTIQAAQFELIRAPLDQLLVVQGGPGTGKTAIALHRVSWLLANNLDRLSPEDVLIVGPNPTFTRYTRAVLPSLGDTNVQQVDIHKLSPPVKRGWTDSPDVARLKGDAKMAGLVERGLYQRVGVSPGQQRFKVSVEGRRVDIEAGLLTSTISRAITSAGTYSDRRQLFRQLLAEKVFDVVAETMPRILPKSPQQLRSAVEPLADRVWPSLSAASFLRDLYNSRDRLLAAAGDAFTAREIAQLHRRAADKLSEELWSDADLAVLDETEHLINGVHQQYAHIVVDEAQDYSPMQLRSIARRSTHGSLTVVGDIAQSTGQWARDSWDEVAEFLLSDLPLVEEELRYGYRVPRQIYNLAAQLLPTAAPTVRALTVVRDGPADPEIHRVDEASRAEESVKAAMAQAARGRSVAIITSAACRDEIEEELTTNDVAFRSAAKGELGPGVNLVSPHEAKGLEFDAVIVVEPESIVAEDVRGHRLLYVALTRTTRYLDIICVGSPLALPEHDPNGAADEGGGLELDLEEIARILDEVIAPEPSSSSETALAAEAAPVASPTTPQQAVIPAPTDSVARRVTHTVAEAVVTMLRDAIASNLCLSAVVRAAEILETVAPTTAVQQSAAHTSMNSVTRRIAEAAAEEIATMLRDTLARTLWGPALARAADLLVERQ